MSKPKSMMGIASPTGSHLPVLEQQARAAGAGLIIEHGAGLYSTPLLARLGCNVICCEPHPGWREWARWIYQGRAQVVDTWAAMKSYLATARVVFIDGPAADRGPLLSACQTAGVPSIIVHDTDEGDWAAYGLQSRHFTASAYEVTHTAEGTSHRTTLWRRHANVPFAP